MASFARSFKSPSYLSPRMRPSLPGRTISNSSEVSLASNTSGRSGEGLGDGDMVTSAPQTPTLLGPDDRNDNRDASAVTAPRTNRSRPIAIELPKLTKLHSAPSYTPPPPDPLSARGDLPGGYFPMHEDPLARIHHPHPFHHDSRSARQNIGRHRESASGHNERNFLQIPSTSSMAQSNTPVASYLPPGFHDSPQPMGKYYPSNWDQHHNASQQRPSVPATAVKSDSQLPVHAMNPSSSPPPPEAEARRRMQQYQRDMVAQAALALNGSGTKKIASGLSLKDLRFGHAAHKPVAPKLVPLGSPGPVTPMELEGSGGGYLDKGRGVARGNGRPSASVGVAAHTIS